MTVMNLLEYDDLVKGMSDAQLIQAAQNPPPGFPQFLAVQQLQENKDKRERYAAQLNKPSDMTVADQVVGEAMQSGIMGAMPPQMAMAPQMAQRMPNMPPQGIQQAMPPQMMSGGGIVRMAKGGRTQEILDLVAVGLSPLQITQKGYEQAEIEAAMSEYNQRMSALVDTPDYVGGPMREIGDPPRRPASGTQYDPAFIPGVTDEVTEFVTETVPDAARAFDQAGDMAQARTGVYGGVNTDFFTPQQRKSISDFIDDTGEAASGIASAYTGAADTMSRLPSYLYGKATDLYDTYQEKGLAGLLPFQDQLKETPGLEGGDSSGRDRMAALEAQAAQGTIGTSSVGPVKLDNTEEQILANLPYAQDLRGDGQDQDNAGALVPNTSEISKYLNLGPEGAVRAGGDDAMLLSGPERASGALNELKDLINKQSKFASSANRGAALVALGTGIMEGKTAEGGRAAAKILSDDAKTQGALQLEGAKIAAADERERNRLAVMREDLQNKLGISQNASNRTALAEVTNALQEYDGFAVRGIADKLAKGLPLTPDEEDYLTLRRAQKMLIPIVAPATRGLFANPDKQQPPPTGGTMKIVTKTA